MSRSTEEWDEVRDLLLEMRRHLDRAAACADAVRATRIDEVFDAMSDAEDDIDRVINLVNQAIGRTIHG